MDAQIATAMALRTISIVSECGLWDSDVDAVVVKELLACRVDIVMSRKSLASGVDMLRSRELRCFCCKFENQGLSSLSPAVDMSSVFVAIFAAA